MSTRDDGAGSPTGRVRLALAAPAAVDAAAWRALGDAAAEANPFFERWFLEPAIAAFGGGNVRLLVGYVGETLVLLAPVVRGRLLGLPVPALTLFRHDYDPLGTPLVHRGHVGAVVTALFDDVANVARTPALVLEGARGDGPVRAAMTDATRRGGRFVFVAESHQRAIFRAGESAERYLERVLDARARKDLRRRERRLAEEGALGYEAASNPGDAPRFAAEFAEVEARGWKGERGTAFAKNETHRRFFEAVVAGAAADGKLEGLTLRVGPAPVALFCALRSGDELFAWKVAYDERYAKMSPGVLLEIENIRRRHEPGHGEAMDSCAPADHELSNRLWPDRRVIETLVLSSGSASGRLVVRSLPHLRSAKRVAKGALRRIRGG